MQPDPCTEPRPTLAEVLSRATRADFCERDQVFLVPVPGDTFMRLSRRAFAALQLHAAGVELEEAALSTRGSGEQAWDGVRLQQIRDRLLSRACTNAPQHDTVGFFLRRTLLPAGVVAWLAARLRLLYRPAFAVPLIVTTVVLIAALVKPGRAGSSSDVAFGYAWMVASLFAHELGHASAVAYFGRRPGAIGFTVYVIYPALYTDVTAAWTLRRFQRVVVDAGGIYFQLLFAASFVAIGHWLELPGIQIGFFMVAFSVAMTLHPFLKFDGYWLLSDALGVADLAKQRASVLAMLWARIVGRRSAPLPWRPLTTFALAVYGFASSAFMVGFAIYLMPAVWRAVLAYPARLRAVAGDIATHGYPHSPGPWLALATATLLLYFAARLARWIAARTYAALRHLN